MCIIPGLVLKGTEIQGDSGFLRLSANQQSVAVAPSLNREHCILRDNKVCLAHGGIALLRDGISLTLSSFLNNSNIRQGFLKTPTTGLAAGKT